MVNCSDELDLVYAELEKELKGFSYSRLDEYAKTGKLDKLLKMHNIDELLRLSLIKFVLLLENKSFYTGRLLSYESDYFKILKTLLLIIYFVLILIIMILIDYSHYLFIKTLKDLI